MKFSSLSLSSKFTLTVGFILIIFCVIFSLILYYNLRQRVLEDANEKTRIILTQIDAIGDYVKEELRPAMFELLKDKYKEDFIVEAMSTTHIRFSVMQRFNNELKDYIYKRVSTEPINKKNKADKLHERLIRFFKENNVKESWNGIIKENGQEFLIMAKPVIVEKGCLICHGLLKDAPKSLINKYRITKDFLWKEGDVMGVETVRVPLSATLKEIKGIAISTFVSGIFALFFLFISIQGAFWKLVSKPLNRLTRIFKEIANGTEQLNQNLSVDSEDEIGELITSFNQMSKHLYEAQEAMKKNSETLKTIFEGITDPLALINPDCTVDLTNQAYREWMSKGIKAVFSEKCEPEKCDPDDICPVCFLKRLKQQKTPISEFWEDEKGHYYYIHLYPIYNENKEVVKAVHYVKDITEKKHIDEQMRVAEKLAVIGQLSAGLAHEINNPLGGIKLCFDNLISIPMDEEMRKKHIDVINVGFQKIQSIISQLLDFSKQTELSISSASINEMVEDVLKLMEYLISKKGIKVIKDLSQNIPNLLVDKNKIEQVFLNIILNAIQAMDSKGGNLLIKSYTENGKCHVSFTDSGVGISADILPRIFDPFFTTKPVGEGTGLGLSVSKSIVEQHGGIIRVETSEKGSTFTVELPLNV